jgi:hypothetical protein
MDCLIYSAVFGGYDQVQEPREAGRYRLITDGRAPWGWEEQKESRSRDPRRAARYWKTAGMPQDAEFTIWLDGNVQLVIDPREVVQKWLVDTRADIALFSHPGHQCLYAEARVVKSKMKDFPEVVDEQVRRYREKGLPKGFGLGETTVLARRRCAEVAWFNGQWWHEIERGSVRDQLSFDYVRWLMGDKIKVHFVDGGNRWRRREHDWLVVQPHKDRSWQH